MSNGKLNTGTEIKTRFGKTVRVTGYIGEGGQGTVYEVEYDGRPMALKWYKKNTVSAGGDVDKFYNNIVNNIMKGQPSKEFLWPLDITEKQGGSFGYIMEKRPDGFYDLSDFMLRHVRFPSYRQATDAALRIVSAFRILHNAGYSYQDINDGNFFINPKNGEVLICDNDNVAPDGTDTGIMGKPRYMAPEIVLRKNKPDSLSDRFSMAVILYIIFCLNHPLEGKRYLVPALTKELQEKLYGSEPIFMFDPDDDRNGPHPKAHSNSITVWAEMPEYMKKKFTEAFSRKAMEKPNARPTEKDWLKELAHFRGDIVKCECGYDLFIKDDRPCICNRCGRDVTPALWLKMPDYRIPVIKGSVIFKCQVCTCSDTEALKPEAMIGENNEGRLGIMNCGNEAWEAFTSRGEARQVGSRQVIPAKEGITFTMCGSDVKIRSGRE